jgi:hypothetical protein
VVAVAATIGIRIHRLPASVWWVTEFGRMSTTEAMAAGSSVPMLTTEPYVAAAGALLICGRGPMSR